MTTEIIGSKLRNDERFIAEIEWVVFDEVHYVNDEERGVVWEEVIMNLPSHVHMLMLSATVENATSFAEWISHKKKQNSTTTRRCSARPARTLRLYPWKLRAVPAVAVQADEQTFNRENYQAAYKQVVQQFVECVRAPKRGGDDHSSWDFKQLVVDLNDKEMLPVVFFAFSRVNVMESAKRLRAS